MLHPITKATYEGREAAENGRNRSDNPYDAADSLHLYWDKGWLFVYSQSV